MINERFLRRALILVALVALGAGLTAASLGRAELANWLWVIGTVPVIVTLFVSMVAAALGWLTPVAAALTQEGIDVLVILNALRALLSGRRAPVQAGPGISSEGLRREHRTVEENLDRLREIADALDDATGAAALALIAKANEIVQQTVVQHEREDETALYPKLSAQLADASGLAAMSRAHREIQHLARLLQRLSSGLSPEDADRYLIRDAQRVIESVEALVRLHNAQEEDIYEHAGAA
jgi:hemerythrin HHE cation binding domain-containing protein